MRIARIEYAALRRPIGWLGESKYPCSFIGSMMARSAFGIRNRYGLPNSLAHPRTSPVRITRRISRGAPCAPSAGCACSAWHAQAPTAAKLSLWRPARMSSGAAISVLLREMRHRGRAGQGKELRALDERVFLSPSVVRICVGNVEEARHSHTGLGRCAPGVPRRLRPCLHRCVTVNTWIPRFGTSTRGRIGN
jgi:hypothetical protein